MQALFPHGETVDLDWKRTFPPGYFDRSDRSRYDSARAELVKDVAAMANAASERVGHLVYGIADQNGQRMVHPVPRTEPVDDAALRQFLARYLDPAPSFEYAEIQHEGQLMGLLRVHRVMPYPHVVRESLGRAPGQAIHKGQVFVRRGTLTEIALHADLVRLFEGGKPVILSFGTPESNKVEAQFKNEGWTLSWVRQETLDQALFNGAEHMYFPDTRRRIEAPGGLLAGQMFLLGRRPAQPKAD